MLCREILWAFQSSGFRLDGGSSSDRGGTGMGWLEGEFGGEVGGDGTYAGTGFL